MDKTEADRICEEYVLADVEWRLPESTIARREEICRIWIEGRSRSGGVRVLELQEEAVRRAAQK